MVELNTVAKMQKTAPAPQNYDSGPYSPMLIIGASTNKAAFIGTAKTGPYNIAVPVSNFKEFEAVFGGFDPSQYLAYAVDLFFKNGGNEAYVVRAGEVATPARASVLVSKLTKTEILRTSSMDIESALSALSKVGDANIVAVPGAIGAGIYEKVISHCANKKRFAILDLPQGIGVEEAVKIRKNEMRSSEGMAATYYPWLEIVDPVTNRKILVPPSGAVAGVFAGSDDARGVHKAPANISLLCVSGLEKTITNQEQESLYEANINPIRPFTGKGFLVWGARTISDEPNKRLINERRLMLYLEHSINDSTQWISMNSNDGDLWATVKKTIEKFLKRCWENGMFAGTRPDDAFFVRCGLGETMTSEDVLNRRLIAEVGVAPARPNEFIVFRISYLTE